jgi:PAS domain-containing protein
MSYQTVQQSVSDIIYVLEVESGRLQFLNSRVTDVFFHEQDVTDGTQLFNAALHKDDRLKWQHHIAACSLLKTGLIREVDVRFKTKDGRYHWFRIRDLVFSRTKEGKVEQLTGIIRLKEGDTADLRPISSILKPVGNASVKETFLPLCGHCQKIACRNVYNAR